MVVLKIKGQLCTQEGADQRVYSCYVHDVHVAHSKWTCSEKHHLTQEASRKSTQYEALSGSSWNDLWGDWEGLGQNSGQRVGLL